MIEIDGITYGNYEVSTEGRFRNVKTGHILKPTSNHKNKYLQVTLYSKNGIRRNILAQRLVATAFIPNPHGYTDVNHKDGNRHNNCVENLEWLPHKNNIYNSDIITKRVRCIELDTIYDSERQAGEKTGIDHSSISKVCRGLRETAGGFHWEFVD